MDERTLEDRRDRALRGDRSGQRAAERARSSVSAIRVLGGACFLAAMAGCERGTVWRGSHEALARRSGSGVGSNRSAYPNTDPKLAYDPDPKAWSGCSAAAKEILGRVESVSPPKFSRPADLWAHATGVAGTFEADPTRLIAVFDSGDRTDLALYWVTLHALSGLEREFDQRTQAGQWKQATDGYRLEKALAATLPHIHTLMSRFPELVLSPSPPGESLAATLDDPSTGLYVLGVSAVEGTHRLHTTWMHSATCGVDRRQEGDLPCGRPFVLAGSGWKIPSFALIDEAWALMRDRTIDAEDLGTRMRDLIKRSVDAYALAQVARFPPGVVGLVMDRWVAQYPPGGGSGIPGADFQPYNPLQIWNPVGPTNNPLLNGILGR